ncbi:hypothetical protein [Streptomyces rubiginosohelvolus]|uniref:hypothetical protein n=1 Tax=Streptomyces rubiginosohelvolus TaxID=67362 RepID=UPI0037BDCF78
MKINACFIAGVMSLSLLPRLAREFEHRVTDTEVEKWRDGSSVTPPAAPSGSSPTNPAAAPKHPVRVDATCQRPPCTGTWGYCPTAARWRSRTSSGRREAVERLYRLRRERTVIGAITAAPVPTEGHRQVFAVAMATLLAEFIAHLDRPGADPAADLVGCRRHPMRLSRDELTSLIGEMRDVLVRRITNEPSPERSRYLISPAPFPAEESPVANSEGQGRPFGCERAE